MKIYNPTGFSSNLTGSFTGSFKGEFDGIFSEETSNNISGAFEEVSSSLSARISSNESNVSSLNSSTSSYLLNSTDTLDGDLTVTGTITAQEFHTEFVSSSIIYESGSTKFGDTSDDIHSFSGSLRVKGSGDHYFTDGNVGIGTTSPGSYDTAIIGSGHKFLNVQASSTNYAVQTLAGNSSTNGNRLGYLTFVNNNNSATYKYSAWIGSEIEGTTANKQGGRLIFSTTSDNSTAGPIERMRINASGNVGIGTTSPSAKLQVTGASGAISGTGMTYLNNSDDAFSLVINNAGNSSQNDRGVFDARVGDSSVFRINNSGNVGIGTTSPGSRRLSVVKDSGITSGFNDITEFLDTTLGGGGSVSLNIGRANSTKNLGKMAFKYASSGSNNNELNFGFYDADNLMTIQAGGNVGIGTTSPASKLHIKTSVDNSVAQGLVIERSANSDKGYINYNGGGFQFRSTVGDPIVFGETDAEHMRILPDGNVGIGTTNPAKKLTVNGSFKLGTNAYIEYGGVYPYTITTANTAAVGNLVFSAGLGSAAYESKIDLQGTNAAGVAGITLSTAATARMVVTADGNVGIGRTDPGAKMAFGNFVDTNGYDIGTIRFYDNNDGIIYGIGVSNNQFNLRAGTTSDGFAFWAGTSHRMQIQATTGNVGIGTTDPDSKLDVKGPSATPADGNQTLSITNSTGGTQLNLGTAENSYGWIEAREGDTLRNLLINPNGGNVGIGTTNPGSLLHVEGSRTTASLQVNQTGTGVIANFKQGGNSKVLIDNTGNVGIGSTSPGAKLDVVGPVGGDPILKLQRNGVAAYDYYISDAGAGAAQLFQRALNNDTGFIFQTKNFLGTVSNALTIAPSGYVGIGTTSPSEKLHVNGGTVNIVAHFQSTDGTGGIKLSDSTGNVELTTSSTNGFNVHPGGGTAVFTVRGDGNIYIKPGATYSQSYSYGDGWTTSFQNVVPTGVLGSNKTYLMQIWTTSFGTPPYYAAASWIFAVSDGTNGGGQANTVDVATAAHVGTNAYWQYNITSASNSKNGIAVKLVNGPTGVSPAVFVRVTEISDF